METVLTVEEVRKTLRLGRTAAYRAIHAGDIPHIRVGKKLLIPVAALEKLLAGDPCKEVKSP